MAKNKDKVLKIQGDTAITEINSVDPYISGRMSINTIKSARNFFSKILRAYNNRLIDREVYRDLIYGFSHFHHFLKLDVLEDLECRIMAVENTLKKGE